jgi:uncharacterized protein YuzE
MRWEYDADAGSLYVYLRDGAPDHQAETADGAILDMDSDGGVLGLELLRAWAPVDLSAIDLTPADRQAVLLVLTSPLVSSPPRGGLVETLGAATTPAPPVPLDLVHA